MPRIGKHEIGTGNDVYIVAELSANHDGSLDRARETIRAAARAGVDAIKLQTYTADTITIRSDRPDFIVPGDGPWAGRSLYDLYTQAHTPWDWHAALFDEAHQCGLDIFSTPFDATAVDLLEDLGVPAYKVASFELPDDGLLRTVAATGKPVILSTGMASLEEITHAITTIESAGGRDIILLRCTSSYPAPDDSMNLASIPLLAAATKRPVGLSDHSRGVTAPIVAATLGACMIEKHFTLSRDRGGVDSHFSLEPDELAEMVREVARVQRMLGDTKFGAGVEEEGSAIFRRSLYIVADMRAGDEFSATNVRSIRPGFGLSPRYLDVVMGCRAALDIERGTPLAWEHFTR